MELLSQFKLLRPQSIADAVAARAAHSGGRFLAGGTDLLPNMRRGLVRPDILMDLGSVAELRGVTSDGNTLRIGAGSTLEQLAAHPLLRAYPPLAEASLA